MLDRIIHFLGYIAGRIHCLKVRKEMRICAKVITSFNMEAVDPKHLLPKMKNLKVWSYKDTVTPAVVSVYNTPDLSGVTIFTHSRACSCQSAIEIEWKNVTEEVLTMAIKEGIRIFSLPHLSPHISGEQAAAHTLQ